MARRAWYEREWLILQRELRSWSACLVCVCPKYRAYIGYIYTPKRGFDDYKVKSKRVYVAHDFMLARYEKT